jgi:very-short-patch-repair endonuclease
MASHSYITKLARELRKRQTPAEKILWHELRNRQFNGVKFFRQHPLIYETDRGRLHFFIPDFYSSEQKLVIELDGKIHEYQRYYDHERDLIITRMGLRVMRFKNEEVSDIKELKAKIVSHFT